MADKAPPPSKTHPATPVVVPFLILLLLGTVTLGSGAYYFRNGGFLEFLHLLLLFITGQATLGELAGMTTSPAARFMIQLFLLLSFMISVWFFYLLISTSRKLLRSNKKLFATIAPPPGMVTNRPVVGDSFLPHGSGSDVNAPPEVVEMNPKWLNVLAHINSDAPADWKLAILEADIMLDAMLEKMGYPGQTVSEKLKLVEKSDFDTLDYAWEAHKIRNSIAHEGSDFVVTKEEAERVVTMFERVFKEFRYI